MSNLIADTLWIYGLAAVVSLLIAAIIKLIVVLLGRAEQHTKVAAPPTMSALPASAAQPEARVVAAIAAAVHACIGEHHIVHIEDARHGAGWAAEGRAAHHVSHRPNPR